MELGLRYFWLDDLADKFLDGNPKRHDLGKLIESIARHGFRDPIALDGTLNGGAGAIAEGNGRLEALIAMRADGHDIPAFIKVDSKGRWAVPVICGADSKTEADGMAYAIDHNNLGLFGGEFTPLDMAGLYDRDAYLEILEGLAQDSALPVAIDGDDLDLLLRELRSLEPGDGEMPEEEEDEPEPQTEEPPQKEMQCTCPQCGHHYVMIF